MLTEDSVALGEVVGQVHGEGPETARVGGRVEVGHLR